MHAMSNAAQIFSTARDSFVLPMGRLFTSRYRASKSPLARSRSKWIRFKYALSTRSDTSPLLRVELQLITKKRHSISHGFDPLAQRQHGRMSAILAVV